MAPVLKTGEVKASVGSNPTLSVASAAPCPRRRGLRGIQKLLRTSAPIAAVDTPLVPEARLHGAGPQPFMAYEPGTTDCRVLIDSKAQIEAILLNLAKLENTEHIRQQLVAVHNQLEGLHELRRQKRNTSLSAA
jgi:hypothetical protein